MPRRITPLADLAALWRLVRVMRRVRPTIVDAHTPKGGLLAMMAAALCRVPVRIYHQHGLPLMTATGLKRRILRGTERTACRLAHQVICISPLLREVLIAEGLCPPGKITVLEHGSIDGVEADGKFDPAGVSTQWAEFVRARYQIPPSAPVIGFVGRVVRDKGLIELAQAWRGRPRLPRTWGTPRCVDGRAPTAGAARGANSSRESCAKPCFRSTSACLAGAAAAGWWHTCAACRGSRLASVARIAVHRVRGDLAFLRNRELSAFPSRRRGSYRSRGVGGGRPPRRAPPGGA